MTTPLRARFGALLIAAAWPLAQLNAVAGSH